MSLHPYILEDFRLLTCLSCSQATYRTVVECAGQDARGTVAATYPLEGGALNHASTCGVVSGGCLAIALASLAELESGDVERCRSVYSQMKEYTRGFERRYGSTICRERTDSNIYAVAGMGKYLLTGKAVRCLIHAGASVSLLSQQLSAEGDERTAVQREGATAVSPGETVPGESAAPPDSTCSECLGHCAAPVLRGMRERTGVGDRVLELLSVALDGGVGLSGGLCGALGAVVLAAGIPWGVDPETDGMSGAVRSLLEYEINRRRGAGRPGLWMTDEIMRDFLGRYGSLECRDIAVPFEGEPELSSHLESSPKCREIIEWCVEVGSSMIDRV